MRDLGSTLDLTRPHFAPVQSIADPSGGAPLWTRRLEIGLTVPGGPLMTNYPGSAFSSLSP